MLQFVDQNGTHYDSEEKIWSGTVVRPYYSRDCSFGLIAFEEMRRDPSHICQISDSEKTRLSNEEARLFAIRIARAFEGLSIKQSDIIGIAGRNTTYLYPVILACFFNGSAYHAISPNYDKKTSKQIFNITQPKVIFCDGQDLEKIKFASSDFESQIFTLKNHVKGEGSVLDLLEPTGDEHMYRPAELKKGTTQNLAILCSSGSTGPPKAVSISHLHRAWDVTNFLTKDDIQFVPSTMDWLSAFMSLVGCITYGATRIISDKPHTPEYFLEVVQRYKVTFTLQSPPSMAALVKCPIVTPEKLDTIRFYIYGGSKASLTSQQAMNALLRNGRIVAAYGFTELNTIMSRNFSFEEKPNSVGLLQPGMKARIMQDDGKYLGPNEVGEILCHHGELWSGYYNNAEATRTMIDEDGWFHSGDLGYFDGDHYLYIVERKKELLKYKGIQFYPSDVEDVIAKIPDAKEVCVFGIESELEGDLAAAAIVKVEGSSLKAEDVIDYVRKEIDADYLQLHGGCQLFDFIPKTANGKIDRKATKMEFLKNSF